MKSVKKVFLPLLAAATLLFAGCGKDIDASGYVNALMENSYKNDSTAFVEMKIGTKEEAEELYEEGIQGEIDDLVAQTQISDGLVAEYKTLMADIYKNVKYTVGEAAKQDDGSFEVEVKYQKMNIFGPAMESFLTDSAAYTEEMSQKALNGEEIPSQEEINEYIFTLMKDALQETLANVTYGDEESMTVRVELNDNTYSVNEDDFMDLEMALFDSEAINEALSQ